MTAHQTAAAAYDAAKRRARYAHRQSVVWQAADGWHAEDYSRDALKAAMLAAGTQGRFTVVSSTASVRTGWRLAVRQLRSLSVGA